MNPKYKKGDILYTLYDTALRPYTVVQVEIQSALFDTDYKYYTYQTFIKGTCSSYYNVDENKLFRSKEDLINSIT